ncbi:MAG: cobalt-precorrin 5A hydrolase, partial [Clostridia bacterium]
MKTAVVSLTKNGGVTAKKVQDAIGGDLFCRVPPEGEEASAFQKPLKELMAELFPLYDRFVMIMATGIVVRTISPLIVKKDRDPAIVVMDEMGRFAISLLSGHLGGANELAA